MTNLCRLTLFLSLYAAMLLPAYPAASNAEQWVQFTNFTIRLPKKNGTLKGYSESYYDSNSVRRDGSSHIQVRLKEITYLGDLEPHIHKELLQIDCGTNSFVTLVEESATPNGYREINRGTIGDDSPYRLVRAVFCGY